MASNEIIHIDDDEAIRDLVVAVLKTANIEILSFPDAETALQKIKSGDVRLIILDMKLHNKFEGEDVLKWLSGVKSRIKVIILTANPSEISSKLKSEYSSLVSECVMKPFEPKLLINAVKKAIGK
ncbi:Regulator of RpoS [Candidatus Tiddalikarchaeum anstoanum]|nr:Regulator of RpoS [Candidatus Tiddalikarchaeum anstoanum]